MKLADTADDLKEKLGEDGRMIEKRKGSRVESKCD